MSLGMDSGRGESGPSEMMGPSKRRSPGKRCVPKGQYLEKMWAQGDMMGFEVEVFLKKKMGWEKMCP